MKTTLILIGILFLVSSCKCFKIKNDIRRVWSFKFNECRCQTYSLKKVRALTKLVPCEDYFQATREKYKRKCRKEKYQQKNPERCFVLPNEDYCDDLIGFSAKSWAKNLTPRGRESKACYEDTCGK